MRRWPTWRARCGAGVVLLAHHRRDQAETLLLQALRGAGPAGPGGDAARGAARRHRLGRGPGWSSRAQAIDAYVRRHRLSYVDDPSNADRSLARNRLRHEVWPALAASLRAGRGQPGGQRAAGAGSRRAACANWPRWTPHLACSADGPTATCRPGWRCRPRAAPTCCAPGWQRSARRRRARDAGAATAARTAGSRAARRLAAAPGGELRLHAGSTAACRAAPSAAGRRPMRRRSIDLSRAGRVAAARAGAARFEVRAVNGGGWSPAAAAPLRAARAQRRRAVPARSRQPCRAA